MTSTQVDPEHIAISKSFGRINNYVINRKQ